ncbi:hypothetical protein FKM82_000042 [Ascaphus truei]
MSAAARGWGRVPAGGAVAAGSGGCLKMADVADRGAAGYWSLDASDEEQHMVFIPGLGREGNVRPTPTLKTSKKEDSKLPAPDTAVNMSLLQTWEKQSEQQMVHEGGGMKSASLKDLCPEDKRRIANLIKELARVSEEKEVTEERLKSEQESFEKQIRQLEDQNSLIVQEREDLQQQYRECQELLSLYQKYLSEQQEKLNRSLSELSAGSSKKQQVSDNIPQRPTSIELNGSYLGQACTPLCRKTSSESGSCHSLVNNHLCRSDPTTKIGFHQDPKRCSLENGFQRKCGNMGLPDLHCSNMAHGHQGHLCGSTIDHQVAHCCLHFETGNMHTTPGRHPPKLSPSRPHESCSFVRHSAKSELSNGAGTRPKEPANGKGISEERKHQLLLQKMELEIEKERLQQLLTQQEAKLLWKQQQLQQSRLDYNRSRSRHAPEPQLMVTDDVGRTFSDQIPLTNGFEFSPMKPPSEGIYTPPPRKDVNTPRGSGGSNSDTKAGRVCGTPEEDASWIHSQSRIRKGSTKNAATSPTTAVRREEPVTTATSPTQRGICRYETSLIDMLEAISPISNQRQPLQYRETYDLRILSPAPRSHHRSSRRPVTPASRGRPPAEDPEESRMLDEIFFIC